MGQTCGNPINNTTGNKFQTELDYHGAGLSPLSLLRYYNSQSTVSGVLGANWTHNYSAHLQQTSASAVTLVRPDQKGLAFSLAGGVWTSTADVNSRLVKNATTPTWSYTTGDDSIESYDANGKLLSITTRAGLITALAYDANNRLGTVTDPFGRQLTITYDAGNRIATVKQQDGGLLSYGYDANNNLSTVTYPDQSVRRYVYENASYPHALTGIVDENGNRFATWQYGSNGYAISSQHAGGVDKVTSSYDTVNGATNVTDAFGTLRSYSYQTLFGVVRTINASQPCANCGSDTAHLGYDANGNIIWQQDFNNNITTSVYDLGRNLRTSLTEASGTAAQRTTNSTWHPRYRLPLTVTEPTRTTTFSYDAQGNLLKKTIAAGTQTKTWTYTYNSHGQPLTLDGPRTDVADITTLAYDNQGNLFTITDALGHVTAITGYNANGQPLSIQDANGLVTSLQYDARGRLIATTSGTEATQYSYDAAGELIKVVLPNNAYLNYG